MVTYDGIIFSLGYGRGGIATYFSELIRQAALIGDQFEVIVHDPGPPTLDLRGTSGRLIRRKARRFERFRSLRGLPPGLLHSSYYRRSDQTGIRNVVTVYDFTYEKFTSGLRKVVHTSQKRAAIRAADAVICISSNTKKDLEEQIPDVPAERLFVTHLAASEIFRPIEGSVPPPLWGPFVLFVGARAGYKNFVLAVEAVRRLPELSIVCVGGSAFDAGERAMLAASLPGRHFHVGSVNDADLNRLYNAAICLIYPSLYEGFGIPPLEAMQAGCPFVALRTSSIPEIAGDAGILLEGPDPDALAAAILRCAGTAERHVLRDRGLQQARKFSWSSTYAETARIYARLLGGSPWRSEASALAHPTVEI